MMKLTYFESVKIWKLLLFLKFVEELPLFTLFFSDNHFNFVKTTLLNTCEQYSMPKLFISIRKSKETV